jgi:hypothetical protein
LPDVWKSTLDPFQECIAAAQIVDDTDCKPAHDDDYGNNEYVLRIHASPHQRKWIEHNQYKPKQECTQSGASMSRWKQTVREFLFGMMGLEFASHAMEMRASLESMFMLGTVGDMLGVPVLPPYYSLRLLPYVVPHIETWKRRVLREREFSDEHDYHLDGL